MLGASTLVMVDNWPDLGWEQRTISARRFVRKCLQLRLDWDYIEQVEFYDILASQFIANTYFELKCRKSSWAFVREAINLATVAGLHEDAGYLSFGEEDQVRRRRAYALLYISERGAAVLEGSFPLSILTAPPLPDRVLHGTCFSIIRTKVQPLHNLGWKCQIFMRSGTVLPFPMVALLQLAFSKTLTRMPPLHAMCRCHRTSCQAESPLTCVGSTQMKSTFAKIFDEVATIAHFVALCCSSIGLSALPFFFCPSLC